MNTYETGQYVYDLPVSTEIIGQGLARESGACQSIKAI